MAITALTPDTGPAAQSHPDTFTFTEIALMLRDTGQDEFKGRLSAVEQKLYRWAREDGLTLVRDGKRWRVSYTAILNAHERRFPRPGAR